MKKFSLVLVLILCFTMFAACGDSKSNANEKNHGGQNQTTSKEPKKGGTFVASLAKEPQGYNPDAKADDGAYLIIQNVFNKLVKINGYDQVVPDLAKSWEFSQDGKTVTFHLQENVKWHDGKDFSSKDVKWTLDEIIKEKGFASTSLADIEEVTCPDKNTVELKLKAPNSGLLGYLAWVGTYIMPSHLYEGTDWLTNPVNEKPIGTGPFKFVEHKKGQNVTIEKNEEFWGDKAYLDKVIFSIIPEQSTAYQAWLNGEIDDNRHGIPSNELSKYENNKDYVVCDKLWANRGYIHFNLKEGKFADLKVRQAVAYGIDRDEIFNKAI